MPRRQEGYRPGGEKKKKKKNSSSSFLAGFAISTFQASGDGDYGTYARIYPTSAAPHSFWSHYEHHLDLARVAGQANAFRLSLEWRHIEPRRGAFDDVTLDHFADILDAVLTRGLVPHVTLHHYVHPQWFEDLGGFTVDRNVEYYVTYVAKVVSYLGAKRLPFLSTFNEPMIYLLGAYGVGMLPPFHLGRLWAIRRAWNNILRAHVDAYHVIQQTLLFHSPLLQEEKEKEKEKETKAFATRDGCQTSDALSFVCFFLVAAATSASKRGVSSSRLRC